MSRCSGEGKDSEGRPCLAYIASNCDAIVTSIVGNANRERASLIKELERRLRTEERDLKSVRASAARLLTADVPTGEASRSLVNDQLRELAGRREQLERSVNRTGDDLRSANDATITSDDVRAGLTNFGRVYAHLRPFEQRDLVRLLISRAELHDDRVVLDVYEKACAGFARASKSDSRFEAVEWLPDVDSNHEHRG